MMNQSLRYKIWGQLRTRLRVTYAYIEPSKLVERVFNCCFNSELLIQYGHIVVYNHGM